MESLLDSCFSSFYYFFR
uniref:Uncharacterized protein n=1 Tax=Arundo donax TaxID=35708 RepID=A0A0A9BK28_ARUDO